MNKPDKIKRENRSLDLIAYFPGYAETRAGKYSESWYFAVPEAFRPQLDIKKTERVVDGKKEPVWTQGDEYCFAEGHVIYDTRKAYCQWSKALKHIKKIITVLRATPNHRDEDNRLIKGQVTFKISTPNKGKTNIEDIGQYTISQHEFVEFLKTGKMKNGW